MTLRKLIITIFALLSLVSIVVASGTADNGKPNDPTINERANACFEGGSLEGQCNTVDIDRNGTVDDWEIEWHYVCGWYLIRFEQGLIAGTNLPAGCGIPPAATTAPGAPIGTTNNNNNVGLCPGTDSFPPCPTN